MQQLSYPHLLDLLITHTPRLALVAFSWRHRTLFRLVFCLEIEF